MAEDYPTPREALREGLKTTSKEDKVNLLVAGDFTMNVILTTIQRMAEFNHHCTMLRHNAYGADEIVQRVYEEVSDSLDNDSLYEADRLTGQVISGKKDFPTDTVRKIAEIGREFYDKIRGLHESLKEIEEMYGKVTEEFIKAEVEIMNQVYER